MNKLLIKSNWTCCLVIGLLLFGCGNSENQEAETDSENFCLDEKFKSNIEFVKPVKQQVTGGIHLTGSVESNPDRVIHFVSLVGGIISKTHFSLGDHVTKGQLLAELRSTELSELQSQSKTLASQIRVAENRLQAVQVMFEDGISSQRELLEIKSDLEILKAEQEKVLTNLTLFSASAEKGVFQIKAPASGIITSKNITGGMQISAEGEALFTISDLSEVWVMVNIYASNVRNVEIGMDVNIHTLSYHGEVFKGQIEALSQVLDAEARVLKARVVLPNENLKLKPGMFVDVMAIKETSIEALKVPTNCLVFVDNQNFLVIYRDDCDLEVRKIKLISMSNGHSYVSEGLEESEMVVSKNQLLILEQIQNFQN